MWRNPQETADMVTFTEEKRHFLCSVVIIFSGVLPIWYELNMYTNEILQIHKFEYESWKEVPQKFDNLSIQQRRFVPLKFLTAKVSDFKILLLTMVKLCRCFSNVRSNKINVKNIPSACPLRFSWSTVLFLYFFFYNRTISCCRVIIQQLYWNISWVNDTQNHTKYTFFSYKQSKI